MKSHTWTFITVKSHTLWQTLQWSCTLGHRMYIHGSHTLRHSLQWSHTLGHSLQWSHTLRHSLQWRVTHLDIHYSEVSYLDIHYSEVTYLDKHYSEVAHTWLAIYRNYGLLTIYFLGKILKFPDFFTELWSNKTVKSRSLVLTWPFIYSHT